MDEKEVLHILASVGAVLTNDHFVLTSGRHASAYVNKDALYPHTEETELLCRQIAQQFVGKNIEVVVGPAIGAVILSYAVARSLSVLTSREVLCVYAEKTEDGRFIIKRGYDKLTRGRRVLVVEDILTTGGSVLKVVEVVRQIGGEVAAVAALCNRGGVKPADLGNIPELFTLLNISLESWAEAECPLCAQGVLVNAEIGKGRDFLARKS